MANTISVLVPYTHPVAFELWFDLSGNFTTNKIAPTM